MQRLTKKQHATIDLILRSRDERSHELILRPGLRPQDVVCRLKRAGAPGWTQKDLTPASWRDCGHGVYELALAPNEFDDTEQLTVLLDGDGELRPPIGSELVVLDVVEAPPRGVSAVPQTILCGHVITLDHRGKPKAVVTARVAQLPHLVGGSAISNDPITVETNEQGYYAELDLMLNRSLLSRRCATTGRFA